MQITIETAGGKKYKIPCHKKKEVKEAIYKARDLSSQSYTQNTSVADELSKLVELKNNGVLTQEEFEQQKKKLLSY